MPDEGYIERMVGHRDDGNFVIENINAELIPSHQTENRSHLLLILGRNMPQKR